MQMAVEKPGPPVFSYNFFFFCAQGQGRVWLITAVTGELETSDKFSIEFVRVEITSPSHVDRWNQRQYFQYRHVNIDYHILTSRLIEAYICGWSMLNRKSRSRSQSLLPLPDLSRKIEGDYSQGTYQQAWSIKLIGKTAKVYIGQTSRALRSRTREHKRAIFTGDRNSLLTQHYIQNSHDFDIDDVTIIDRCSQWSKSVALNSRTANTFTFLTFTRPLAIPSDVSAALLKHSFAFVSHLCWMKKVIVF